VGREAKNIFPAWRPDMERCTSCGSALPDAAQFCGYCGRVVITIREMPTHMSGNPVMNVREGDTPPTTSGSSHPVPPSFLSSGEYGDSSIRSIWPKGEMTQQMPASEEEEYEEEERRALLDAPRSEEHTSELQSPYDLVCR